MKRMTLRQTAAVGVAFAAALAAPANAQEEPRRGGTLVVARPADVNLWDPKYTNDNASLWAQHQVFANLIQNSADGLELRPSLAESWEISEDSTTYTFNLRQDASFCNGDPITAEDVKFSFDRATEADSNVSWQFPANPVVTVIDDHTVQIDIDRPNVAFVSYLTLWGSHILSKDYAEEVGPEGLAAAPMGSGAFCLEDWQKGQVAILTPNPGYWDPERPYVDRVEMRVVQDDNARILQLRTGEVDVALLVPFSQAASLANAPGVEATMVTIYGTAAIVPNIRNVPELSDVKVRQAISYAVDREAMIDAILLGNGEPAESPFYGPGILYHTDEFATGFDLERAKQLMAESSAPDGFEVDLTIPSGDEMAQQTAVILNDQLGEIGIQVNVMPVEAGTWWSMWSSGEFEMVYKLGTNDVIDPAMNIPFDFWPKDIGGSDSAFSGYANERIIEISVAAEGAQDPALREELYTELQQIAMEEVPQLYLFHPTIIYGTRDNVENFAVFPTKLHRFWEVWLSE
ncbi:ABC transporter substrate-binding protein [Ponticoccus sp. SC2-23]|uniref:ABC transporter substrate-binding protein n=1 Tax=Alexandriicola marinus TaxID=2081710 RepID=UPI000FD8B360|nr:ABC transporter substrate-binding protein [Alexandriicola marinus]MBM1221281.1 ABC transporter substrate-binding protein [Ponticoccus sp. SC6-9]MBM1225851.1 ABC transporter substrate-binding protein [Ponticoccus sp. SC6-15]MBM1228003.1 ABC transporter substrate-binding protein [Ponticoccus sp. SC6-38]MBM1234359.1 ABC transporter substrate-binding protein [Ponticoccus sp. SC6-45]MBM1238505.1 ABC transporter substrate-binding protein [Ponticoccus sp. SC6-49]MBM1243774.1 ABC transporter subst